MPVIESQVDSLGEAFVRNRQDMLKALAAVRTVEDKVRATEAEKQPKFHKRGQLMPRERVNLLLDRGTPFLEISTLAGYKQHDDKDGSLAGGNSICGIGYVCGVRTMVTASNSAIKGGTITPWGLRKSLRMQDIAMKQKLPIVSLLESGGANLLYQAEIFIDGGTTFANQAMLSAAGVPQITVVHGSSTAGGAYVPGLSDYTIMVRKNAKVFLAGPPLLKAAKVLSIVNREKILKEGREPTAEEESKFAFMEGAVIHQFDRDSQALSGTSRLYDDGLIDPRDTRRVLAMTLSICREGRTRPLKPNSFGVARF